MRPQTNHAPRHSPRNDEASQMAYQQQLHLNSLQIILNGYQHVPKDGSEVQTSMEQVILELLKPFLPQVQPTILL